MKLFARLRKRQRAVAVVTLPLLVTVWMSAAASACPRMAVDSHDHAPVAAVSAGHHAAAHDQAAHGRQGHSADGAAHASTEPERSHRACPHCPGSAGGSSSDSGGTHVVCALLDDVSDGGPQSSVNKSQLEQLPPAAQPIYVSSLELRRSALRSAPVTAPVYRTVALNLRHCVFLI